MAAYRVVGFSDFIDKMLYIQCLNISAPKETGMSVEPSEITHEQAYCTLGILLQISGKHRP